MSDARSTHPKPGPSQFLDDRPWRLEDLIDFEFLLEEDRACGPAQRDRLAALVHAFRGQTGAGAGDEPTRNPSSPGPADAKNSPRQRSRLFRRWLEFRRHHPETGMWWPGSAAVSAWRFFLRLVALVGLVAGAGAAGQLLRYDGVQPVNVAAFLGWLVMLQILLALLATSSILLHRTRLLATESALLIGGLRWAWSWLASRLNRHALDRIPAEHRTRAQSFLGTLGAKRSLYGELMVWPLLGALQRMGTWFNLGALATTLALVLFSDRAFGWQSAVNISPARVSRVVQTLAWPWSHIFPAAGAPTPAQIEGSKIVLKDGIKQLATENLVAWWPFLCLALAMYGLLPRLVLWAGTVCQCRRALRSVSFHQAACDRLWELLTRPELDTSGSGTEPPSHPSPAGELEFVPGPTVARDVTVPSQSALAFVSEDLIQSLDATALARHLASRFDLGVHRVLTCPVETAARQSVWRELSAFRWQDGRPVVVVLEEAWQPPIAEKLNFLRQLRSVLGPPASILLVLVGRPSGTNPFTPVRDADWNAWERNLASLGDPNLRLEPLVPRA